MLRSSYNNEKASCVNIKVIVRCRPLNEKEKNDINNEEVVKINNNEVIVTVNRNNEIYEKKYSFDYACDKNVDQKMLFNNYIFQIVDEVLEGFNCTLFCYGQTGTGKTYTMEGKILELLKNSDNKKLDLNDSINSDINCYYELCENDDTGIIFRVTKRIFEILSKRKEEKSKKFEEKNNNIKNIEIMNREETFMEVNKSENKDSNSIDIYNIEKNVYDFNIKVSYLEIYNEELCDLLSSTSETNKLKIYEDTTNKNKGLNVDKLEERTINSFEEIYYIICSAIKKRRTAETSYNKKSSRSHSIFTITLIMKDLNSDGESITKIGKLNLVDLAGSENALKSSFGNLKIRQQESCNINQSLLTLGRVINALIENSSYIPYRDSKLTRLLQDSLGGKTKTFIVATISPSSLCIDETLSTLDYVFRAKNIKNKPEINVKTTKQLKIKDLNNEIEKLRNALNLSREKRGVYLDNEEYNNIQNSLKKNKEIILQKEKILFEKSKKIKTLLSKMDYTDDMQNQIINLMKDVLSKYKNIQSLHEILINKMVEEKYITQFLINELHIMEEKYYNNIKHYRESQKKISSFINENFVNLKKNIQHDNSSINEICKNVIQILVDTKKHILENKQLLIKSIKGFHKLNSDLYFKKKDLINFVLDHLDIIQKYDQNYIFIIEKIKKNILTCKIKLFTNNHLLSLHNFKNKEITSEFLFGDYFSEKIENTILKRNENISSIDKKESNEYENNDLKTLKNEKNIEISLNGIKNDNEIVDYKSNEVLSNEVLSNECDNLKLKSSLTKNNLIILKELTLNNEGIDILEKIDNYFSIDEINTESLIECIKNISNLFHIFLKSFNFYFKKNIDEKTNLLNTEKENIEYLIENFDNGYKTLEENLSNKKCKIINNYKTKINEEIQLFQDKVLEEIKIVISKNVDNINKKINTNLESLNNELNKEAKRDYKDFFMSSLKTLKTFLCDYNEKTINFHKEYHNLNDEFYEKVEKYYSILDDILIDLNKKFIDEEGQIKNNIKNIFNIYNNLVDKNNKAIDKIAEQFDHHTNTNIKEKEQLYEIISKKILQEKNEVLEEEQANIHALKSNENIKIYNNLFIENIEKCNIHINDLIENLKKDYFQDVNIISNDEIENKEEMKNINEEIKKIRSSINSDFINLNNDGEKNDFHYSDYVYNDNKYLEIKKNLLKEIEDISFSRNIDFKCLFEKINENLNFIIKANEFPKSKNLSGEYIFNVNSSTNLYNNNCNNSFNEYTNNQKTNMHISINNDYNFENEKIKNYNDLNKIETENENTNYQYLKEDKNTSYNENINTNVNLINTNVNSINTNVNLINTSVNSINTNVNSINTSVNSINTSDIKYPTTKIKVIENSNTKKNSPTLKRLKEDNYKNRKFKLPRRSKN
ncbi:kinesin-5, putative [Plasmodium gallinaceum]|uniref:Kinesin-5, putative n=1 Tax=Plasmodium gallinaceum TaxID=5849 RepID=A0A1J1GPQ9_PLAGA|nr:kinesin-5, putative [Plasmodium gallinaceum]CRG94284.1 kinesin-5, putative [Plasmodium gallinaceum]